MKRLGLVVALVTLCCGAFAQISITEDTTWSTDQILTQSVVVEEGATLTITGGVHVTPIYLDVNEDQIGDISITVNGQLNLTGDVCNRVVFTPYEETSDLHYWEGIYINSVNVNDQLRHFNLEYASEGLQILSEAVVDNAFVTNCPTGITTQDGSLTTIENSWAYGNQGSGILLLGGTTTINNTRVNGNGKFGVANAGGHTMVMGFCTIEENSWGGLYMGGGSINDVLNSTFQNNQGAGIEISDWSFPSDFSAQGSPNGTPTIEVHSCNFLGNAESSSDFVNIENLNLVDIPNWGACQDLAQNNDGESDVFEVPFGYITQQSATMARYCGGGDAWQSSWDRHYKLRNAYNNDNIGEATQTGYTTCECGWVNNLGNRYHASVETFTGSYTPTDQYYWYIGENSTSDHGIWDVSTNLSLGGYEVYSSVGATTTFDFTNNYWGTFIGVNELVFDVNNPNTDYSAFVTEEFPFAYAEVDDGLPVIPLGDDTNICEGTGITLDAGNPGSDYLWMPGEFTTQTLEVFEMGVYTVTVTNDCGSNTEEIEILAVDPLPLTPITPVGQTLLCPNSSNTSYTINDADFASEYQWEILPAEAGSVSGTGTTGIIDWDDSYIGSATLKVMSMNDCGASTWSSELEIDVINAPTSPAQPVGETAFCAQPFSSEYTTEGSQLSESYTWDIIPAEAGTINGSESTATVEWNDEYIGTAEITVTGIGYCGAGSESESLTVSLGIYEATISGVEEACIGETITLSANEADDYEWSVGGNEQTLELDVMESQTVTLTINDDDGCEAEASISITALELPNIMISGDMDICPNESTVLTATGGEEYLWSTNDDSDSIEVSPSNDTSYSVEVVGENGCTAEWSVDVTVHDNPTIAIAGPTEACEGESITLEASGADSYSWSGGPDSASNTVSPSETTTYEVEGLSEYGCLGTAEYTVTTIASPSGSVEGPSLVCAGENITLTASGGTTYDWDGVSDQPELVVSPEETTTYVVEVGNANGCVDIVQWLVEVSDLSSAMIDGDSDICQGDDATLIASGGASYVWNTTDEGAVLNVTPTQTTEYSVEVTNADDCSTSISWIITVHEAPDTPTIVPFGGELLSSATEGNQWYYEGVPLPNATNQTYDPTQNGNYWVVVTDEFGCSSQSDPLFVDVTSVDELSTSVQMTLSPVPASELLQVQFEDWNGGKVTLEIYDPSGRVVERIERQVQEGTIISFGVQNLANGNYFLRAYNNELSVVRPFAVAK